MASEAELRAKTFAGQFDALRDAVADFRQDVIDALTRLLSRFL